MFKTGDIVLHQQKSIVFVFDEKNKEHMKLVSRCRYLSFDEIQRYKKLGKSICSLNEIDINRKTCIMKKITIKLDLSLYSFSKLQQKCNELNFKSYNDFIDYFISEHNNTSEKQDLPFKQKYEEITKGLSEFAKLINSIKS